MIASRWEQRALLRLVVIVVLFEEIRRSTIIIDGGGWLLPLPMLRFRFEAPVLSVLKC